MSGSVDHFWSANCHRRGLHRDNANCRADSIGRRLPINVWQVEPMKLLFCGVHRQAGTSNLALSLSVPLRRCQQQPPLHVRACLSLVAGTVGITGAAVGAGADARVAVAAEVAVQTEALFAISSTKLPRC